MGSQFPEALDKRAFTNLCHIRRDMGPQEGPHFGSAEFSWPGLKNNILFKKFTKN